MIASENKKNKNQLPQGVIDFIAGGAGGVALVLAGHPFDTLKVRLQTDTSGRFKGLGDCVSQTYRQEGLKGFYKGISSPLLGITFVTAICFYSYNQGANFYRRNIMEEQDSSPHSFSIWPSVFGGITAGIALSAIETPVELVKAKLQVQYGTGTSNIGSIGSIGSSSSNIGSSGSGSGSIINNNNNNNNSSGGGHQNVQQYKGTFDCVKKITSQFGIRGMFQGLSPTICRNLPANLGYFMFYDWLKNRLQTNSENGALSPLVVVSAGGSAGAVYWIVSYPADVVKSRMQTDHSDPSKRKFKSLFHCASTIFKEGGTRAFFRGFVPCLLRAFPSNGACFCAYEFVRQSLSPKQ